MVAIVSGNGLGLSLGSLATLGQRGVLGSAGQGRNGEQAYVNVFNGNLVLQDFDDKLVGRGLDSSAVRTYNSQGLFGDDNGDNWLVGAHGQKMQLSGTAGTAGSTLVRTDRDGARASYAWDAARSLYVSTDGAGAFDTVAYDAGSQRFIWTDGDTGLAERYEATGLGRLLSATDPAGNAVSYAYNANGTLQSMVNANGEATYFDYSGTNLTQIRTVSSDGVALTRVRYSYDAANRLSTVSVDLSPEDNTAADGRVYLTTYTYDGASKRIASVTQSDGTSLAFTYVEAGADFRVATVTDGLGHVTAYAYDTAARTTTVTDAMGFVSVYSYDSAGQLTQIKAPPVGGVSQLTVFSYDASGNVTQVTDARGFAVTMQYDLHGNQTLQRDAAGNTVERSYNARNQVLSETAYLFADPDGAGSGLPMQPLVTRYVYDGAGKNQLRFVVSAQGRVREYRYDSYGQRVSSLDFAAAPFGAAGEVPTESEMVTWVGMQDRSQAGRTDTAYDARGQVQKITVFSRVDALGEGIADGGESTTLYVWDRAGRLLGTVGTNGGTTQFTYDGLGRQLSARDALNQTTLTSYDDAGNKTVVTLGTGLSTTSAFDRNGRLVSIAQSSAQSAALGTTTYAYDKNNRLILRTTPEGARTSFVYDEAGRLVGEIDGSNRLTEYVLDASNRVTHTVVYATSVSAGALTAYLANPDAAALNPLGTLRPASNVTDLRRWNIYDSAGRLVRSIAGDGAVTDTRYDGASHVVATNRYAGLIDTTALGTSPTLAGTEPAPNAAGDRVTRSFYDADGLLLGTLDAEGFLTVSRYDAKGRLAGQTAYATPTSAALRAAGTLEDLIPASSIQDQSSFWLYDAQNRPVGQIDAEGYLTERVYDEAGNVTTSVRYANRVRSDLLASITTGTPLASLRPSANAGMQDRVTSISYDLLNRMTQQTNYEGTATQYVYDAMGNLVSTISAVGTGDVRTVSARYDVQGRLTGELTGVGNGLLAAGQTQAQIDAIWAQHSVTHAYDAAGRRVSTTDANGNKTLFFYDLSGHLTHTVNASGEVVEQQYNTLGQLAATIRYGSRIALNGLTGGAVTGALTALINSARNATLDSKATYTYGATGRLSSSTDALGNVTLSSYNAFGDLTGTDQVIGGSAHLIQSFAVDRRGLAIGTVRDAAGVNAVTSAIYDAFGRPTRSVDANGNVRQQGYDRLGRIITITDPLDAQRSSSYDAFDRVLTHTDALGNVTSYTYDDASRSVTIRTPENITVTTVHTRHGQTQSVTDGNGNTTSYSYDLNGNRTGVTTALTSTSAVYDRGNRLIQSTDANGNVVTLTYDASDRLLTRTLDPAGLNLVTTYRYDAKGQQIGVTDSNGTLTQIDYDLEGRVTRQSVDPTGLNLVTAYTYDGLGRTLTVVAPRGTTTQYSYDALGRRVQERVDPAGLNLTRSYTYDKNGNLTSTTDANGQVIRYAYDAQDRLVYTLDPLGGLQRNHYDTEGRLTQTVAYATPINVAGLGTAPTVAQIGQKVVADATLDTVEYRVLDKDGRLAATVNGLGEVVKFVHDGNGKVVERIAFAKRIALSSWTAGSVPAPVADAAHDQRTRFVYDALGRATYSIDGVGAVVRQIFDGNGNVVERFAYSTTVPAATAADAASLSAAVALVADAARDTHEILIYDRAGRLTSRTDGVGAVTLRAYDKNGNLTSLTDAKGQVTRFAYDAFDRLVFTLGPLGQLEKKSYDAEGHVTLVTRYAASINAQGLSAAPSVAQLQALVVTTPGQDQQQHNLYDKGGRLDATVDALGGLIRFVRDGNGNVTEQRAYANRVDMAAWIAGTTPTVLADDTRDQRSRSFYDAAGRKTLTVDAMGYVQQTQYDGTGRVTLQSRYPLPVPGTTANSYQASVDAAASQATSAGLPAQIVVYSYDAAGRRVSQTSAFGRPEAATTNYVYDGLGQLVRTVEARGVELSRADTSWALVQRQRLNYLNAGGGALLAAALTQTQRDALAALYTTTSDYDAAGRKISVTDALGGVTRSAYDATGHVVKITDPVGSTAFYYFDAAGRVTLSVDPEGYATATTYSPLGETSSIKRYFNRVAGNYGAGQPAANAGDALTQFEYDAMGRLTRTIDAENHAESYGYNALGQRVRLTNKLGGVTVYTYDLLGRKASETLPIFSKDAAGQSALVVNRFAYDAFGNTVTTTEAAGLPEQRITEFTYDRLNRQVTERHALTSMYVAGTGWTIANPLLSKAYDANGNVTVTVDANGNRIRAWFDANSRKIAEVSATGTLSTWQYDAAGNVLSQRVYGDRVPLPAGDALPSPLNPANVRETTYQVDANNHVRTRTIANLYFGARNEQSGQFEIGYGNLVEEDVYNANGQVVRHKNGLGALTYTWYDKLGQKILEVDAMGYGTRWERDANGAVVRETRFATAMSPSNLALLSESNTGASVLAKFTPGPKDRVVEHTYDHNGRVLSESVLNVVSGSVASNGALSESSGTATRRIAYDNMGNQVGVTDALGQRSDLSYDLMGRLLRQQTPAAADLNGAMVRQTTDYEYDGLDNVRREIRRGTNDVSEADDQILYYGYDASGERTSMTNAKGETVLYGRDANGNSTAQMVDRVNADGSVVREIVSISYDGENREISRFTGLRDAANSAVFNEAQTVTLTYNAWGDMASRRTGTGDASGGAQEYFDYDAAGRLWRTNSQDGINKAWFYDLAGNATLLMQSQTVDLRTLTMSGMIGRTDILQTITAYDKRNQAISVTQPRITSSRPNLVLVAMPLSVESGQYGGLNLALGSGASHAISGANNTNVIGGAARLGATPINLETTLFSAPDLSQRIKVDALTFGSLGLSTAAQALFGQITQWRVEVRLPNGELSAIRYVDGAGTWPKRVTDLGTFTADELAQTSVKLYAVAAGQDIEFASSSIQGIFQKDVTWTSGTFLRLSEGEVPNGATIQLYNRPLGSTGPFSQSLAVFKAGQGGTSLNNAALDNWYVTRVDGLTGPTELVYVVTLPNGDVLRRDLISWTPPMGEAGYTLDSAPRAPVFTTDGVGHFTGLTSLSAEKPSAIRVSQRAYGSNDAFSVSSYGAAGIGRFDVGFGAGAREVVIEMLNAAGVVIDSLRGKVDAGSSLYDMRFVKEMPSTITFQGIPLSAQTLTVEYRALEGGPSGFASLSRAPGSAVWVWDTLPNGLVPNPQYLYGYDLKFVARDADGFRLVDATARVTIGASSEGTRVQMTGSQKLNVLTFDPGVADGQTLKLRYREKGTTGVQSVPLYGPPVVTGKRPDGTLIFGNGYGAFQIGTDALGRPIYGAATALSGIAVPASVGEQSPAPTAVITTSFELERPIREAPPAGLLGELRFDTNGVPFIVPVRAGAIGSELPAPNPGAESPFMLVTDGHYLFTPDLARASGALERSGLPLDGANRKPIYIYTSAPFLSQLIYANEQKTAEAQVQIGVQPVVVGYETAWQGEVHVDPQGNYYLIPITSTMDPPPRGPEPLPNANQPPLRTYTSNGVKYVDELRRAADDIYLAKFSSFPNAAAAYAAGIPAWYSPNGISVPIYQRNPATGEKVMVPVYQTQVRTEVLPVLQWYTPEDPAKFIVGQQTFDFLEATAVHTSSGDYKWDASALRLNPDKEYEYQYDVYNAAGVVVGNGEGYFRPDSNAANDAANVRIQWVIPNVPGGPVVPGQPPVVSGSWEIQRRQSYDAFGQVVSETDGNGNVTSLSYNALGLLTEKRGAATNITLANGQIQNTTPTEQYSYNLNGQLVGKRDANGNQSTLVLNAAGQAVEEWHPAAGSGQTVRRKAYDVFGNLRAVTDEIGRVTTNAYDQNNRLVRVDRPLNADGSHAVDTYEYDVLGQRIAHANALGFREKTYYDSMGRVSGFTSAEGRSTSYAYTYDNTITSIGGVNTGGWVYTTVDANGRAQIVKNDVFGRMMWKQDLGGHQFSYAYNWSGLIAAQTGTSGQNIAYSYYGNGYLKQVIDAGTSTESTFEYDSNGNRIFEGYKSLAGSAAMVFQQSYVTYDEHNRVRKVDDGRYTIEYEYDANGNRRRVHSVYKDGISGVKATQDYWYKYDAMDRFTVTMGQLVNGDVVRGSSGDGVTIEYDNAGQRRSATYASDGHGESYQYDGSGGLTSVYLDGVLRSRRTNDLAGRVTLYEEFNVNQTVSQSLARSWDRDNQLRQEHDNVAGSGTRYERLADGTLSATQTYNNANPSATTVRTTYAYDWWDSAKQTEIKAQASNAQVANWAPGYSKFTYDVNGHVKLAIDQAGQRTFNYWTNAEGQVLERDEFMGGTLNASTGEMTGARKNRTHRYFYFDGKRVGNVGNDGTEREDYAQQLARDKDSVQGPDSKYRKFTPTNSADFDENYQPINAGYPGAAPGSYTVRAGDTLEGIARAMWGDATLWYLLAEANGLDGQPSAPLVTDTVLSIPNRVTNVHNTSSTFRPYDAGKAMGDTSPTMPDAPAPPQPRSSGKKGCGGVGKIIMVVVAVVATVWTAGAALAYFAPAGTAVGGVAIGGVSAWSAGIGMITGSVTGAGLGVMVGAGAIGGAVGSIAAQGAGIATGVQEGFSWKGVALGAISGAVSGGMGYAAQEAVPGLSALRGSGLQATVGRQVLGNAIGQGVGVVTGLQQRFDWKGVAASAASGYVSAWAGGVLPESMGYGRDLASRMAGGLVTTAVRGGSVSRALPGIIGDALGSTVGNALGDSIAAANGQGGGMTRGEAEERAAAREVYAMGDGIPRVNGLDFSQDAAMRKTVLDPYNLSDFRGVAPISLGSTTLDVEKAQQRVYETGRKPVYDFGDPLESGDVGDQFVGGSVRVMRGNAVGRGGVNVLDPVPSTVNGVSVNQRADALFQGIADLSGAGDMYRDIKLIGALMSDREQQNTIDRLKGALQDKLGMMRVLPSEADLGAVQGMGSDGVPRYDKQDLIDRYSDANRKVELMKAGVIELDTRSMLITSIGTAKLAPDQWVGENMQRYQAAFAAGVDRGQELYDAGKLRYRLDMPEQLQVGLYADDAARSAVIDYNKSIGVPEGAGQLLSMNRWSYDPSGSGNYNRIDLLLDLGPSRNGGALILRAAIEGKSSLEAVQSSGAQLQRVQNWVTPRVYTATPQGTQLYTPRRLK